MEFVGAIGSFQEPSQVQGRKSENLKEWYHPRLSLRETVKVRVPGELS